MANVKISQLPAASAAAGANEFEINESGTSKKVTGTQILNYVASASATLTNKTISSDNNTLTKVTLTTGTTGSALIPAGTTGQRDGSPSAGYFRFNSSSSKFEGYNGTAWGSVGGGAVGGGSDEIFYENGQNVTSNYTLTTNKNAMSAGPITIDSGVTVTIPSGSAWVVV